MTINPTNQGDIRNYIINPDFKVAQAATTATIVAGNAVPTASLGYPVADCWFAYSLGTNATLSVIGQSGTTSARLQLATLPNSSGAGIGQRIESLNAFNLAGKAVTLSFDCSHSNLNTLVITANRPTTTANTFGTIASPTKTQVATTSIPITSTLTRYNWTFTCSADVDKGLEILFTIGSNTSSGTLQLANIKLEEGGSATTFIPTIYAEELRKSQRFFAVIPSAQYVYPSPASGGYAQTVVFRMPATMRVAPVVVRSYSSSNNVSGSPTTPTITPDFFIESVVAGAQGNVTWTFNASCFAYIP